jgi:hypothetical protein
MQTFGGYVLTGVVEEKATAVVELLLLRVRSDLLLAGSVLVAWKLASKLYEQVLLRRGTRISWRSAIGLLRRS